MVVMSCVCHLAVRQQKLNVWARAALLGFQSHELTVKLAVSPFSSGVVPVLCCCPCLGSQWCHHSSADLDAGLSLICLVFFRTFEKNYYLLIFHLQTNIKINRVICDPLLHQNPVNGKGNKKFLVLGLERICPGCFCHGGKRRANSSVHRSWLVLFSLLLTCLAGCFKGTLLQRLPSSIVTNISQIVDFRVSSVLKYSTYLMRLLNADTPPPPTHLNLTRNILLSILKHSSVCVCINLKCSDLNWNWASVS